ncbi:hypothetical protein Bmyc01_57790 [Bacillus mycoides]|nr:hypothetical protein Bmyc01_57790 [Bacillus mycoides]
MVIRTKRENLARKGVDENKGSKQKRCYLQSFLLRTTNIFMDLGRLLCEMA